jgi:polyisoprenoid-binding protein YceI
MGSPSATRRIASAIWPGGESLSRKPLGPLDAGAHPDITFVSRRLEQAGGRWVLHGLLSVRGKAHPVELLIEEVQQAGPDLRLRASVRLDRYDFGITKARGLAARHLGLRLDIVAHRL